MRYLLLARCEQHLMNINSLNLERYLFSGTSCLSLVWHWNYIALSQSLLMTCYGCVGVIIQKWGLKYINLKCRLNLGASITSNLHEFTLWVWKKSCCIFMYLGNVKSELGSTHLELSICDLWAAKWTYRTVNCVASVIDLTICLHVDGNKANTSIFSTTSSRNSKLREDFLCYFPSQRSENYKIDLYLKVALVLVLLLDHWWCYFLCLVLQNPKMCNKTFMNRK